MGAATSAPADSVEGEKARFNRFKQDAVVTERTLALIGAPTSDGYGIGYRDSSGINRAFIVPTDIAIDLAQGILQEINADRELKERNELAGALIAAATKLKIGVDFDTVTDEVVEALNKAA